MSTTADPTALLNSEQAATLLGVEPATLADWRHRRRGPEYIRLGVAPRAHVRYRRDVLDAWLSAHTVKHDAEAIAAQAPGLTPGQADALGAILRGGSR